MSLTYGWGNRGVLVLVLFTFTLCILQVSSVTRSSMRRTKMKLVSKCVTAALSIGSVYPVLPVHAAIVQEAKQTKLSSEEIARIVKDDIDVRQALVTADFTRSIYSEQATFTDEIDTYEIDKYVAGTKALFDAKLSNVAVDGTVQADPDLVSFRFKEKLTFNIPFKPYVMLSGRVELKRDPKDGLIYNSREFWDETPSNVIKSVKLN